MVVTMLPGRHLDAAQHQGMHRPDEQGEAGVMATGVLPSPKMTLSGVSKK